MTPATPTSQMQNPAREMVTEEDVYRARIAGFAGRMPLRPRLIDLFSGAGGMSAGFCRPVGSSTGGHLFTPVWANDFNESSMETYAANFGAHVEFGDIVSLLSEGVPIPEADIVIGGPPCQGFSLLNKDKNGDPRRHLWRPFMEVVRRSGASVWVMENVPQLIGSPEYDDIINEARAQGFLVKSARLCAADYGVPQVRWRTFIVGARDVDPGQFFPPAKTHVSINGERRMFRQEVDRRLDDVSPWRTVRDGIADLPEPQGTEIRSELGGPLDLHFGRNPTAVSVMRYKAVPEGGNRFDLEVAAPELTPECWKRKRTGGTDLFGRLWWDRPAVTIRTEFFKPEKGRYLHPVQNRPITHREAARLQTFPDEFVFRGSKTEIAKQIGNAVPPRLAARVADSAYAILLEQRRQK